MKALLVTFGSYGDVYPLVGLGRALQQRGLDVAVLTSSYFEATVVGAGLEFVGFGTAEQYEALTADKNLWHPRHGFELVTRAWIELLPQTYEAIRDRYIPGQTVVVATAPAFGARVAQEHLGVPLATVHLQPASFRSLHDTPRLPVGPPPAWQPRIFKRFLYWMADQLIDRAIAEPLNAFRSQLQLPPVRRVLQDWWLSPQLVIGLFPAWFAAPQPDWPPPSLLTGFPLYDGADLSEFPAEAAEFLREGSPPIVFTPGSAMRHGASFFRTAVEACQSLSRRGLLLTRYREQVPAPLPPGVRHFDYLPLSQLLPRCAAIVHHGGVGTTAQGFAAGIPQLMMPMAFDQPDNAARAERLGVARSISRRAFRPVAVARLLDQLLERPEIAASCLRMAQQCHDPHRLDPACDAVERGCRL